MGNMQEEEPFWGGKGRSSVDVALTFATESEVARLTGGHAVTCLLDISKAYARVSLDLLWDRARQVGFPLRILGLCLQLYAAPRVVKHLDSVSEEFSSLQGVLAGCTCATRLLRAFLQKTMVDRTREYSNIRFCAAGG